jgi:hypothetical protein
MSVACAIELESEDKFAAMQGIPLIITTARFGQMPIIVANAASATVTALRVHWVTRSKLSLVCDHVWPLLPQTLPPSGGSHDQTSLRRQSPQNGNIRGRGRRLSPICTPSSARREFRDGIECAKSRDFRPIPGSLGKPGRTLECVAALGGIEPRYSQMVLGL